MDVAVYKRPTSTRAADILTAFARGVSTSGGRVEFLDPLERGIAHRSTIDRFDIHVVFSSMYNNADEIIALCKLRDKPVIVIDAGYMDRENYFSIGLGGINANADFKNSLSPDDRFQRLNLDVNHDAHGSWYVLIVGQHRLDMQCAPIVWAQSVLQEIRKYTDEPVVYRPHPEDRKNPGINGALLSKRSLLEDVSGARYMVTHNSNVVVDSVLRGIPILTTGISVCEPVAKHDFKYLDVNKYSGEPSGNSTQLLNDLAYAQWTIYEMEEGIPFRRLMGLEKREQAKKKKRIEKRIHDAFTCNHGGWL
jgi:hypothetical protein